MKSILRLFTSLVFASFAVFGCANMPGALSGWTTLLDGTQGMENWNPIGDANWGMVDGMLQADKGSGFLISKNSYGDFQIRVEFWADSDANSGIFIRMSDIKTVTAGNSYEVNIFDKRPGQEYSTGAIVDVAKVSAPIPKVGGQWSVYEITAKGSQLTVTLNGVKTVDVQDSKHARGPLALQYAPGVVKDKGVIKFRKVQVRAL
jgi:Domain of Unknown Function (DUF1080)